jgi:uncharacterized protein
MRCAILCVMRIDEQERFAITSSIKEIDPKALIYLFGSRVDPQKRGGDIDILIISVSIAASDKPVILRKIFEKIEEQKIDLVIKQDTQDPFVAYIMETAVPL